MAELSKGAKKKLEKKREHLIKSERISPYDIQDDVECFNVRVCNAGTPDESLGIFKTLNAAQSMINHHIDCVGGNMKTFEIKRLYDGKQELFQKYRHDGMPI